MLETPRILEQPLEKTADNTVVESSDTITTFIPPPTIPSSLYFIREGFLPFPLLCL